MIKNRIAKEKFYKKIGVTSANFRGKAKESDVNSQTIAKIFTEIPDVNIEWLLTGKGEILNSSISINENDFEKMYYTLLKEYKDLSDELRATQKEATKSKNTNIQSIHKS